MSTLLYHLLDAKVIFVVVAGICAAIAGFSLVVSYNAHKLRKVSLKNMNTNLSLADTRKMLLLETTAEGIVAGVIRFLHKQSMLISLKPRTTFFTKGIWRIGTGRNEVLMMKAGLKTHITQQGFCHARALLCLAGLCAGALLGAVISDLLMVVGGLSGATVGWRLPRWALDQEIGLRKEELESHLSEMLEVTSLGLRSGLSFDQSFGLYHQHFKTSLGRESASTQQQWQLGLTSREDALREFARTYDSPLFSRVIENIIRSLRFGTSLADSFDSAALEARLLHKAQREEEVAKAPVKMLVPTAALILPAMLLLVLGPVLLDMMQGF